MIEVPLVYHSHVYKTKRYAVDVDGKRLIRETSTTTSTPIHTTPTTGEALPFIEETLPGAASVSPFQLGGSDVVVSTSGHLEDLGVLCVALSWSLNSAKSVSTVEINTRDLELGQLVKVEAFPFQSSNIQLTIVDDQGIFVKIYLNGRLEALDEPIRILKPTDYISELSVLQQITGSSLQPSMISFISSSVAVMALMPFIFSIDLEGEKSQVWSETQCMEDMKARSSTLQSLFTGVSDLFLGRADIGEMDMPPTSALCFTSTLGPSLDSILCITLHSDASIRKWRIDPQVSLLPIEVVTLDVTSFPFPSTWSDSRNSVSLTAREYDQIYALAVHIKTNGAHGGGLDQSSTDCHLWVLHGSIEPTGSASCLPLTVPETAFSLVGMDFSKSQSRCQLSVLFETVEAKDRAGSILATYPASMMSIVSPTPTLETNGSLDNVALQEIARIHALRMDPTFLEDSHERSLEYLLQQVDGMYMKYLFRPMYPRGNGTVLPPSDACIRRALAKMVHGAKKEPGVSIELETVKTMYEWRYRENRKLAVPSPMHREQLGTPESTPDKFAIVAVTSPYSVYETYVNHGESGDGLDGMDVEGDESMAEKLESEKFAAVEAHESRWRRLLVQVWEEEQPLRCPLCMSPLGRLSVNMIVRAGVTTVVHGSTAERFADPSPWHVLDRSAMGLLERVEANGECSERLLSIEHQAMTLVSSAVHAMGISGRHEELHLDLLDLSQYVWNGEQTEAAGAADDGGHESLDRVLSNLPTSQLVGWVQEKQKGTSEALGGVGQFNVGFASTMPRGPMQVTCCQLRHAACSLSVRAIDKIRRVQLSRLLLIGVAAGEREPRDAALRAYLHTLAVLWTSAQRVPVPHMAVKPDRHDPIIFSGDDGSSSQQRKRPSLGDDAPSILAAPQSSLTNMIDVLIVDLCQSMNDEAKEPLPPLGVAVFLSRKVLSKAFRQSGSYLAIRKPSSLPELGSLPYPRKDAAASDYPRLALRLLGPYVMYPVDDRNDLRAARKEAFAESLFIESHSDSAQSDQKTEMRRVACQLLVPKGNERDNPVDQRMIRMALDALQSLARYTTTTSSHDKLRKTLHQLVHDGTDLEINRMCEMDTIQKLFSPIAEGAGVDMDGATSSSVRLLANSMLHISRVIYRLTILERHLGPGQDSEDSQSSEILLGYILNAINDMENVFTKEVCRMMKEYATMWSQLFSDAVVTGHWEQAFDACMENPETDRKESNLRRLVRSMVDAGALGNLLNLCLKLDRSNVQAGTGSPVVSGSFDLYEIASEVLAEAVSHDLYTARAASPGNLRLSDFQGALYSLHASQKQWRRAAQSMDLRYLNAGRALVAGTQPSRFGYQSAELREGLIVEDMVLASVAAANCMDIVKEGAHRFLISGEHTPYSSIPLDDDVRQRIPKRLLGSPQADEGKSSDEGNDDRLSKFMGLVELDNRAVRSIALRNLYFDRSTDNTEPKIAFLRALHASDHDVNELFKNGYYRYGLLLAKAWGKSRENLSGIGSPNGQDMFSYSLSQLLFEYLIPIYKRAPSNTPSGNQNRPTLLQVRAAMDDPITGQATYTLTTRYKRVTSLPYVSLNAAVSAFVRQLTVLYSSAKNPVAVGVAKCLLDDPQSNVALPSWLEHLLLGVDAAAAEERSGGLFGRNRTSNDSLYAGDPSSLIRLYTKSGMLARACEITTTVLRGFEGKDFAARKARAPARLPEKGDIDFVPYTTIDLLWNLTELAMSRGVLTREEMKHTRTARDEMKSALEEHFALMKISELGMRSARALQQGE